MNIRIILGAVFVGLGLANPGTIQSNKMDEELKRLSSEYADLFAISTEERASELDFKIADLDWEGIYLAVPKKVSDSHKPPIKRLKPIPDMRGRKPDSGEGFSAGVTRRVIGDSQTEPLASGEYAISLISYGRISNQCRVHKEGKPESRGQAIEVEAWPWDVWGDTKTFQENPSVPVIPQENGVVLTVGKQNGVIMISGGVATKARSKNLISLDQNRNSNPDIQGGIHVDLILTSLDRYPPEIVRVAVPILGSSPLHVGDSMKGCFSVPFPFQTSPVDRMLYAFADGYAAGPVRIPAKKQ